MILLMARFWARLTGKKNNTPDSEHANDGRAPAVEHTAQGFHDKLTEVRFGERWPGVLEVSGEREFRRSFQKIFSTLGRAEGGVTFQDARMTLTQGGLVAVQVMGEIVGYLDEEDDQFVAKVKRELARIRRGEVAVIHARIWAISDQAGLWRARVSLAHDIGKDDREEDFRADRLDAERRADEEAAAYEAARAEREAQREAKAKREADAIAAGSFDGAHVAQHQATVTALKAAGETDELAALLVKCVDAAEAEALVRGVLPVQWPTTQLSMIYRARGDYAAEVDVLERYAAACGESVVPTRIANNLAKARVNATK